MYIIVLKERGVVILDLRYVLQVLGSSQDILILQESEIVRDLLTVFRLHHLYYRFF